MSGSDSGCEQMSLIPVKKMYYSISEVCRFTGLEPHVLRYWESEFPQLRPKKNRAGNRAYREKDIELICNIKKLLYEEKFTIPGAKKRLQELKNSRTGTHNEKSADVQSDSGQSTERESVCSLRRELEEILDILKQG
ncbi:MAG: MerR family transcriptional regulator [Chitinispirillaceae bacterium]